MTNKVFILLLILLTTFSLYGQRNNGTLKGNIKDEKGAPLDMVNIALKEFPLGTVSNRRGEFVLRVPAGKDIVIVYSSLGYKTLLDTIQAGAEQEIFKSRSEKY